MGLLQGTVSLSHRVLWPCNFVWVVTSSCGLKWYIMSPGKYYLRNFQTPFSQQEIIKTQLFWKFYRKILIFSSFFEFWLANHFEVTASNDKRTIFSCRTTMIWVLEMFFRQCGILFKKYHCDTRRKKFSSLVWSSNFRLICQ